MVLFLAVRGVLLLGLLRSGSSAHSTLKSLPSAFKNLMDETSSPTTASLPSDATFIAESVYDLGTCDGIPTFMRYFRANACLTWLKEGQIAHGSLMFTCSSGIAAAQYYTDSYCNVFSHTIIQQPINQCLLNQNMNDDVEGYGYFDPTTDYQSFNLTCYSGSPQPPTEYDPWFISTDFTSNDCDDSYIESVYYVTPSHCFENVTYVPPYVYEYTSNAKCVADTARVAYSYRSNLQLNQCQGDIVTDDYTRTKSSMSSFTGYQGYLYYIGYGAANCTGIPLTVQGVSIGLNKCYTIYNADDDDKVRVYDYSSYMLTDMQFNCSGTTVLYSDSNCQNYYETKENYNPALSDDVLDNDVMFARDVCVNELQYGQNAGNGISSKFYSCSFGLGIEVGGIENAVIYEETSSTNCSEIPDAYVVVQADVCIDVYNNNENYLVHCDAISVSESVCTLTAYLDNICNQTQIEILLNTTVPYCSVDYGGLYSLAGPRNQSGAELFTVALVEGRMNPTHFLDARYSSVSQTFISLTGNTAVFALISGSIITIHITPQGADSSLPALTFWNNEESAVASSVWSSHVYANGSVFLTAKVTNVDYVALSTWYQLGRNVTIALNCEGLYGVSLSYPTEEAMQVSAYVINPTSSPTLAPSNTPQSSVKDDDKGNDDYYYAGDDGFQSVSRHWYKSWGIYSAYFGGILIVCLLLDVMGTFDFIVKKLEASAYNGFREWHVESTRTYKSKSAKSDRTPNTGDGQSNCLMVILDRIVSNTINPFIDPEYLYMLQENKAYFGCKGIYCDGGLPGYNLVKCQWFNFPEGWLEDMTYYICNNHMILGMFMSSRNHPFSRASKRIAFFGQNCFAFFVAKFLKYFFSGNPIAINLLSIFVVAPVSLLLNKFFFTFLVCSCIPHEIRGDASCGLRCLILFGKFVAYPCSLLGIGLLLFVALFTKTPHFAELSIIHYAYAVNAEAAFYDFFNALVVFGSGYQTLTFKLMGYEVYTMGDWFKQSVEAWKCECETTEYGVIPYFLVIEVAWGKTKGLVKDVESANRASAKGLELTELGDEHHDDVGSGQISRSCTERAEKDIVNHDHKKKENSKRSPRSDDEGLSKQRSERHDSGKQSFRNDRGASHKSNKRIQGDADFELGDIYKSDDVKVGLDKGDSSKLSSLKLGSRDSKKREMLL